MKEKQQIRQEVKVRKQAMLPGERAERSAEALHRIEENELFIQAKVVVVYFPLPDELDTRNLLLQYADRKTLLLPVVEGDDIRLKRYEGMERMKTGPFGIAEPSAPEYFTHYEAIDLIIVPGIAFTPNGERLGRGRGYYDRFLPLLPRAYRIGVAYRFQIYDRLPCESHDCRMDQIIVG